MILTKPRMRTRKGVPLILLEYHVLRKKCNKCILSRLVLQELVTLPTCELKPAIRDRMFLEHN
jgi:hypothetical protein